MISGGLRFYNARLAIGGFVSTVRSDRANRVVAILRLAPLFPPNFFSFFSTALSLFLILLLHRRPLPVAVSVACPPRDCPYYEKEEERDREKERKREFIVFVVGLCRRVDDEISSA